MKTFICKCTEMSTRRKVLSVYKQLHRTCRSVFKDDDYALKVGQDPYTLYWRNLPVDMKVAREKIQTEFRKHLNINSAVEVRDLLLVATDAEMTLRTNVVQAKINPDTGNYRLNLTKDTYLSDDNKPFNPKFEPPKHKTKKCT